MASHSMLVSTASRTEEVNCAEPFFFLAHEATGMTSTIAAHTIGQRYLEFFSEVGSAQQLGFSALSRQALFKLRAGNSRRAIRNG